MKSKFTLIFAFWLFAFSAYTQQRDTVLLEISGREYSEKVLHFIQNHESVPVGIKWKMGSNTMKSDWDVEFCDCGSCFVNDFPDSVICPDLDPGADMIYSFRVNPHGNPDERFMEIDIEKTLNGITEVTTLTVITKIFTSAPEIKVEPTVKVYPIIVNQFMYIDLVNTNAVHSSVRVFDLSGRLILSEQLAAGGLQIIDLGFAKSGIYLVEVTGGFEPVKMKIQKI